MDRGLHLIISTAHEVVQKLPLKDEIYICRRCNREGPLKDLFSDNKDQQCFPHYVIDKSGWRSSVRYISCQEEQILLQHKSAYERVLEQAALFMKREAALWVLNSKLLDRAKEAEAMNQELKERIEILEEDKKKFEETNVLPFKQAIDPKEPSDNWLLELPVKTVFSCRPKLNPKDPSTYNFMDLAQYHVWHKSPKGGVLLFSNTNEDKYFLVDSSRFSRQMELFEVYPFETKE